MLRSRTNRIALRALHRSRSRLDRFKLTDRAAICESLLSDSVVTQAIREHATENGISLADTRRRVESYIGAIVPFFNISHLLQDRVGRQPHPAKGDPSNEWAVLQS